MADSIILTRVFTNENHTASILKSLNEQRLAQRFCDVILRVGKNEAYAHSTVLAAASPYFGAFLGQGQDNPRFFSQKIPQIIEIHIDGSGDNAGYPEAVSSIVEYMYNSKLVLTSDILTQVIEIAKIMQMSKILDFCSQFELGEAQNTRENVLKAVHTQTILGNSNEKAVQTEVNQLQNENVSNISKRTSNVVTRFKRTSIQKLVSKVGPLYASLTGPMAGNISSIQRKRGRPMKELTVKKVKEEVIHDSSANESIKNVNSEITVDLKGDNPAYDIKDICKTEVNGTSTANESERRLPSRKTRGKKPSKFKDDSESDSDALVVDEADELEDMSQNAELQSAELRQCDECPYSTHSIYHYNRHQLAHKNEKIYKCNRCEFSAPKLKVLQTHEREHLHVENICSFCDYEAENADSLSEHLQIHQPPNPFHCAYCGIKYKTRAQLNIHLPKHLNVKPFVCEICKAGFKWKHALKCHMATHSETKDHLCDVCGFSTAHKSQLKAHKLIHTGDTFKCDYPNCRFQSIKKQSLKYHMLTHTQEKPHQCEICGQSFSLVKNLKRHSLLHTDIRPYKCTFNEACNFATTRYDKLKDHLLKFHRSGKTPSKRFRLSDYPKSMVPPENLETEEASEKIQNIIHIRNSDNGQENNIETKVYIQQPGGEAIPVTLVASKFELPYQFITRLEN